MVLQSSLTGSASTARDATVQRIEMIIQEQFSLEIKNKEHEAMIINEVRCTTIPEPYSHMRFDRVYGQSHKWAIRSYYSL